MEIDGDGYWQNFIRIIYLSINIGIYIYIYIYIYSVIHRQTVTLYHNSSVSLDPRDTSSRDQNDADFTLLGYLILDPSSISA